jgi:uncharacterized protein (TIGR02117 family)
MARFLVLALLCGVAGCAWTPVEPYRGGDAPTGTLFVIDDGFHTEIGLASDELPASLDILRPSFPGARYFAFGWGQRQYYMDANPGFVDFVMAGLPSSSVLLVVPLAGDPKNLFPSATVLAIPVSRDGEARLGEFLAGYLAQDKEGGPIVVGTGGPAGSIYYASTGTYSLIDTCNTWTAEALAVAGLPVGATGVLLAAQVVDRARPLAR